MRGGTHAHTHLVADHEEVVLEGQASESFQLLRHQTEHDVGGGGNENQNDARRALSPSDASKDTNERPRFRSSAMLAWKQPAIRTMQPVLVLVPQ